MCNFVIVRCSCTRTTAFPLFTFQTSPRRNSPLCSVCSLRKPSPFPAVPPLPKKCASLALFGSPLRLRRLRKLHLLRFGSNRQNFRTFRCVSFFPQNALRWRFAGALLASLAIANSTYFGLFLGLPPRLPARRCSVGCCLLRRVVPSSYSLVAPLTAILEYHIWFSLSTPFFKFFKNFFEKRIDPLKPP